MSLEGIRAKLDRADESIHNVNLEISSFLRDNYRIERHFDAQSRKYVFSAFGESEVPPRFSVLIGEVLYNLRSALDHLVTQLARIGPGGGKDNVLEFPICRTSESFKRSCERGKIHGVSPDAAKVIENLQPYRASSPVETSTLLILHDLNRADKHRLLVVVVTAVVMADALVFTKSNTDFNVIGMSPPTPTGTRPTKDGTEIFSVLLVRQKKSWVDSGSGNLPSE